MNLKRNILMLAVMLLALITEVGAKEFTLVIDAGHGGHDTGAPGKFSKEKDINLKTALAFGKYVEKNCPDVKVIYTRKKDVFVELKDRAGIANKAKADLFISIHTDALENNSVARGMTTYTLGMHRAKDNLDVAKRENSVILIEKNYKETYQGFDPNSAESYIIFEFMQDKNMQRSVDLATFIQNNTCKAADRPSRGVKQAGFLVLRETSMPSCLVELGFITTPAEEKLLNEDVTIDNIAKGIYNAFVEYKKKYDNNITVPYKAEEPTINIVDVVPGQEKKEEVRAEKPDKTVKAEEKEEKKEGKKKKEKEKEEKEKEKTLYVASGDNAGVPVFKVQILATDKPFKKGDAHFKGRTDYNQYTENGMTKYTIGETTDYNEILRLKSELQTTFGDCFVVAFKEGQKMNISEAIKEYKRNKK
ncbi:MAG: N-acetylmuramoyl-L-alanine amidase [Prevotella sp.]|nr:N-acetylmuramoyl-L-alanine amidase [Prevotella sp.]